MQSTDYLILALLASSFEQVVFKSFDVMEI